MLRVVFFLLFFTNCFSAKVLCHPTSFIVGSSKKRFHLQLLVVRLWWFQISLKRLIIKLSDFLTSQYISIIFRFFLKQIFNHEIHN